MERDGGATAKAPSKAFAGPRMVFLAFLIKNLAVGLTYGTFGALLIHFSERFDASLAVASFGLPLVVLCSGLLAPVVAWLLRRFPIRAVMATGCLLASGGYVGAAFAPDMIRVLLCFGLLIGPGVTLMGLLPCYVLVSNWYARAQGRAIGVVNMPVGVMIMPLATTALLVHLSYVQTLLLLAAGYLLALPAIALVVDRPGVIGQTPFGAEVGEATGRNAAPGCTNGELLRKGSFILVLVGLVATMGPAVATNVHLIPLLVERGLDRHQAALLLSVFGGAAALGSLAYGALADRFGPKAALILNATTQSAAWLVIFSGGGFPAFAAASAVAGAGVGGMMAALSVHVTRLYGAENLARALGLINFAGLPVLFLMAPLTAAVREATGSYDAVILAYAAALSVAAGCWLLGRTIRASAPALNPAA